MTFSTVSRIGSREINEDCLCVSQNKDSSLFLLCDGLGGHGHGEVASAAVCEEISSLFESCEAISEDFLSKAILCAQEKLMCKQREQHRRREMKTTLTALLICKRFVQIAHVGDSRVYVFKKGRIVQRTMDHSIPQLLATAGDIKEKEIRHHPDRNILLRVMGIQWEEPKYEIVSLPKNTQYDAYLLCSDGFWENIDEKQMCRFLKQSDGAESWIRSMTELVEENGKARDMDNYSAIVVWI